MILFADAARKISKNLESIRDGKRPAMVRIGRFTESQLAEINQARQAQNFAPLQATIIFKGFHIYRERCIENDYIHRGCSNTNSVRTL